jgi:polyphosphate kinase 2 (PPK2 family)
MVERTSTDVAPWHLVPANNKQYARVFVLNIVCDALEAQLSTQSTSRTWA